MKLLYVALRMTTPWGRTEKQRGIGRGLCLRNDLVVCPEPLLCLPGQVGVSLHRTFLESASKLTRSCQTTLPTASDVDGVGPGNITFADLLVCLWFAPGSSDRMRTLCFLFTTFGGLQSTMGAAAGGFWQKGMEQHYVCHGLSRT